MKYAPMRSTFALTAIATAMFCTEAIADERKSIVIKIDGKELNLPEGANAAVDKAMSALDEALASKELASVNVNEIRETIRKAIDDAGTHGTLIQRRTSSDANERGNPYSAREVREFKQTLADGTVIQRGSTRLLARDGEGRTRQELRQADGTARVFVNDPVDKRTYIIDPQKKAACRADFNDRAIHDCFSQMRGDWKPLGFAFSASSRSGIGMMSARDDLTVEVSPHAQIVDLTRKSYVYKFDHSSSSDGSKSVPTPPLPPIVPTPRARGAGESGHTQMTREKKTQQPYEGLSVDTERSVETIVAGSIGNSKPIETIYERYYSPELKTNVYVRRSDPRNGDSTYRMTDIKRSEPDASLFRVPAGYSVSEGKK